MKKGEYVTETVCLRCGCRVRRVSSEWSWKCGGCGLDWSDCKARGGEDLAYRTRSVSGAGTTWEELDWRYVPAGCLGVFGEVGL